MSPSKPYWFLPMPTGFIRYFIWLRCESHKKSCYATQIIYFANFSSKQEYLDTAISILCIHKAVISTQSNKTKAKVVNFLHDIITGYWFSPGLLPQ